MSTAPNNWSARKPILIGIAGILFLVIGIGGWSVGAKIEGAIVASGRVQVESYRQAVQHQDGGTVSAIMIREGDPAAAGQVLMRFDDSAPRSERVIIQNQLDELLARGVRLKTERDKMPAIVFPKELRDRVADNAALMELMDGQQRLFFARKTTLNEQILQLQERANQFANQILGLKMQIAAVHTQVELVVEELLNQQKLLGKGLAQASQVTRLLREKARLEGQIGELDAATAQTTGRIAETTIESLKLENARREEAIATLRDVSVRITEFRQRLLALDEIMSRLELRAPTSGIVFGLQVHAIRAVVRAAEPVLYIVPDTGGLVVQVRIPTVHIDQIHQGQQVSLNLTAFDQRRTPIIAGIVTKISPDTFTDETSGEVYYQAEARPDAADLAALSHVRLLPGMPVDAFLHTGPRTPISYLLKPMADYFVRAFREG